MIHKEMCPDGSTRMKIHATARVRPLGHNPWQQGHFAQIKFVGKALHGNRLDKGIGNNNFFLASRRGVTCISCLRVCSQKLSNAGEVTEEFERHFPGIGAKLLFG